VQPDDLKNCAIIHLQRIDGGPAGSLSVAEAARNIRFPIKRVYSMTGMSDPATVRGRHAHRALEQALFCLHGSCLVELDDGTKQASLQLDRPDVGLYVGPLLWHDLRDFSAGAVILVLASDYYEEADYIRDYAEFQRLTGAR
jgi:dTDP-4-dehydrorhamnose 3,5-epimerase-like enzyme